jgi:hypothetical protein
MSREQKAAEVTSSSAALISSVQEVFRFSPFGLSCQLCNTRTIQLDERSIQIHLKKHGVSTGYCAETKLLLPVFVVGWLP